MRGMLKQLIRHSSCLRRPGHSWQGAHQLDRPDLRLQQLGIWRALAHEAQQHQRSLLAHYRPHSSVRLQMVERGELCSCNSGCCWLERCWPAVSRMLTSRFMTSTVNRAAISAPPTARVQMSAFWLLPASQAASIQERAPTIANEAQCKALKCLVPGYEVIANGVDDEPHEFVFLQCQRVSALHCD